MHKFSIPYVQSYWCTNTLYCVHNSTFAVSSLCLKQKRKMLFIWLIKVSCKLEHHSLPSKVLYFYLFHWCLWCLVPSAAPTNVTANAISSTEIQVSWSGVPVSEQNGLIRGYKVCSLWDSFLLCTNNTNKILSSTDNNSFILNWLWWVISRRLIMVLALMRFFVIICVLCCLFMVS